MVVVEVTEPGKEFIEFLEGRRGDAIAARGLLCDVETLHLDRGYDNPRVTQACSERGLRDVVCGKRRPPGAGKRPTRLPLGMRWPVEPEPLPNLTSRFARLTEI